MMDDLEKGENEEGGEELVYISQIINLFKKMFFVYR